MTLDQGKLRLEQVFHTPDGYFYKVYSYKGRALVLETDRYYDMWLGEWDQYGKVRTTKNEDERKIIDFFIEEIDLEDLKNARSS